MFNVSNRSILCAILLVRYIFYTSIINSAESAKLEESANGFSLPELVFRLESESEAQEQQGQLKSGAMNFKLVGLIRLCVSSTSSASPSAGPSLTSTRSPSPAISRKPSLFLPSLAPQAQALSPRRRDLCRRRAFYVARREGETGLDAILRGEDRYPYETMEAIDFSSPKP